MSHILSLVGQRTAGSLLGVGIDISKEGIAAAAREYPNHIWCAADIANAPFFSRQFDYILNILSPANSREFYRLLRDDGMIIKVIPESRYLMELRAVFYKETNRQVYSNKEVKKTRFSEHFDLIDSERLCYRFPLKWGGLTEMKQPASKWGDFQLNGATPHQKGVTSRSFIEPLIQMTPLSWGAAKDKVEKAHEMNLNDITID
ncbi:rRNA (guanine-N1)-methyltransferase [Terrilactibacillus sp. S3-3]|nr:rRNA (guanine-N1)-methyltransferase [Terrilactibacillus sp. S3-3]